MKRKPTHATIGVISEGTLLSDDLLDAFSGELRYLMKRLHIGREDRKRYTKLLHDCKMAVDALHRVVNDLEEALNELAPPYAYFGQAGRARFGFFPCRGNTDDLPTINAGDEFPRALWGEEVLIVNDHGNVDCGRIDARGRFHVYWSCV